jgi:hypothetical protein
MAYSELNKDHFERLPATGRAKRRSLWVGCLGVAPSGKSPWFFANFITQFTSILPVKFAIFFKRIAKQKQASLPLEILVS